MSRVSYCLVTGNPLIKFCLKRHILSCLLLTVVVCFVGHNFLKNANLSISKKPRARVIASSQALVCKETLKKIELPASNPLDIVSAITPPSLFFVGGLNFPVALSTLSILDKLSSSISSRAPPFIF
jgi:hypothetical protein